MTKRLFDLMAALLALCLLWPLLLLAAVGILLLNPGPILYRAQRVGRHGKLFTMLKLRTMVCRTQEGSSITAPGDARVFPFGQLLRASKIDELPQLVNILRGEMSFVGPRPEAVGIVDRYYTAAQRETLTVAPGFTSPGVLYAVTHGEAHIGEQDPEGDYATKLLPTKMALDRIYVQRVSLWYDIHLLLRTVGVLLGRSVGRRHFADPPELAEALALLP